MPEITAAAVVIGNEILSGKVTDTNSPFLAAELRTLGVALKRIAVVPDELDEIAIEVRSCHEAFDVVFTSGGVGPTHDDITMEGIARALGRRVVSHPDIESKLRVFYGDKVNRARLKMAEVPEGAELITDVSLNFPTIKVENIYILPGIPEIFRQKFLGLKPRFLTTPYCVKVVYTGVGEGTIAEFLDDTLREFPELMLGSYPKIDNPEYMVKVTLESKDAGYVERALQHLLRVLPAGSVVRTEE
ncbi:MAG: competence/damage-inducible protein A [Deltaproteobacteria bacterium]|nr:competence/damage-inducible protein A [Deltaproteobacteria bacterium]